MMVMKHEKEGDGIVIDTTMRRMVKKLSTTILMAEGACTRRVEFSRLTRVNVDVGKDRGCEDKRGPANRGGNRRRAAWKRRQAEEKPANGGKPVNEGTPSSKTVQKCHKLEKNTAKVVEMPLKPQNGPHPNPEIEPRAVLSPMQPASTNPNNTSSVTTERVREIQSHHDGIAT